MRCDWMDSAIVQRLMRLGASATRGEVERGYFNDRAAHVR